MTEAADPDLIRLEIQKKLEEAQKLAALYTRTTHSNPEFVLGREVLSTPIAGEKLARCRVLGNRYDMIREMPNAGNVVEVGTQTGYLAHFILTHLPQVKLFTIDVDYSNFQYSALNEFIEHGRLETIENLSWEALAAFPDEYFSWVYVDASHSLEDVRKDLTVARTKVPVGGFIICNDYTIWSPFEITPYGVIPAVNEFLQNNDYEVTHFALQPFGYNDIALRRCS